MRLILHAGTHKTGTSTIQQALWENRQRLAEAGLWYPDPREHFGGTFTAHHPFAHAVARQDPRELSSLRAALAAVRERADGRDVLMSAEPVYRHVMAGEEGNWWRRHSAYLKALAHELALVTPRVSVALVFRRRDTFAESIYHERVANGFELPFPHLVAGAGRLLDYERQVQAFRRAFQDVNHVAFESLAGPAIVGNFLAWLDVDSPALETGEWARLSVDARLTLWMAAANRDDSTGTLVTQRRRFCKSPVSDGLFDDTAPRTLWDDLDARRELLDRYGDRDPIVDDRPPAVLTPGLEDRIDEAFDVYLESKGLPPTRRRERRHAA